jgi:VWFA-related protein
MRTHSILLLALSTSLVAAAAVHGQANLPAQPLTLHTGANLVLVDVVVTDHDKPVLALARSRFHVFEEGKEQSISSFDEHQPGTEPPAFLASQALPPDTYTNVPMYPESSAVNVLLLDGLNTSMGNQMQVRHKMIEYLGTVKPGTTLAIFTLGTKLQIVTQFTNDPASLLALFKKPKINPQQSALLETAQASAQPASQQPAVQPNDQQSSAQPANQMTAVTSQPSPALASDGMSNTSAASITPMNAAQALQQFQADSSTFQIDMRMHITLDAMKQLAGYLGGIPGRKNVIWFSGSFPLVLLPDSSAFDAFANLRDYKEEIQKATEMLTAARVAIYPVDAHGLWASVGYSASQKEQRYAEEATMQQVADDTGGQAFLETNDLDKAVASATENGASYYTLTYVPKNGVFDGKYRKIEVRLDDGHGLKLAFRRGYYADAAGSGPAGANEAASVFSTALAHDAPGATAILFKARVLPATDAAFQNMNLPVAASGEKPAAFKGPAYRYIVDLTLDPHGLALDIAPDGTRKASVELGMIAYDDNGQRLNYWTHAFQLSLNPAQLPHLMESGIALRLPFDLPAGNINLRIGVHDLNVDRAGSLEVPLQVGRP